MVVSPVIMCFSPEVDVLAELVVGAIGIDALRNVSSRRAVNLIVVGALTALLSAALISLRCAWAAIGSMMIAGHLRNERGRGWDLPSRLKERLLSTQ